MFRHQQMCHPQGSTLIFEEFFRRGIPLFFFEFIPKLSQGKLNPDVNLVSLGKTNVDVCLNSKTNIQWVGSRISGCFLGQPYAVAQRLSA